MDELLSAVADLRVNGTPLEEREFDVYKRTLLAELRAEEVAVLKQIKSHHMGTLRHMVMVALDTEYIARSLGLSEDKVLSLRVAALFHDIGKLDVHEAILDLPGYSTMIEIWRKAHPGLPDPKGKIIELITIRNVIDYYADKAVHPTVYRDSFHRWLRQHGVQRYLDRSIREYLNHHLSATRRILEEMGMDSKTVEYAASHHPSYFNVEDRALLPPECRILEVADKFNAIIQSEGVRHYATRKMRVEALNIIVQELREEFGETTKESFGHYALSFIVRKYLPPEVQTELLPKAEALITVLKRGFRPSEQERKDVARIMAVITATLALDTEFGHVLDTDIVRKLQFDLAELQQEFRQPAAGATV